MRAKADKKEQDQGLFADTQELNLGYQITDRWNVSTGARKDEREYTGPLVPLNREQGERTDGVLQVGYDSGASWRAYAFGQNTLSKSEERPDNDRYGTGGSYRLTERFRVDAEVSDGDLGPGGRLGTNYLFSERTTLYLNYALENERTDNGLRGGRRGNLISGMKRRLSDSSSMFVEERYQETDDMSGLTHATGMTLAPNERWNFGANTDIGTLTDELTGAKIDREAGGIRMGYGFQAVQLSSAVEYRLDKTEQPDTATVRAHDVAVPEQLQVPAQSGLARGRQVQPREERELARAVLRRRLHRSGARLRLSPGGARPAQRAREVHILL